MLEFINLLLIRDTPSFRLVQKVFLAVWAKPFVASSCQFVRFFRLVGEINVVYLPSFSLSEKNMGSPNDIPPPSKAGLPTSVTRNSRFCARGGCSRTLTASQPPENTDLYEENMAGIRLRKPLSNPNHYFNGGGNSTLIFTPSGEYPCELQITPRLGDWVGTDIGTVSMHLKQLVASVNGHIPVLDDSFSELFTETT